MKQESLSKWLKAILIGVGLCGLAVYFGFFPLLGEGIVGQNPEYAFCFWPWLIFLWATGVPCFAALVCAWKIAGNIGRDRSFSMENARLLRLISYLAAGDAALFFLGNAVFLLLNMSHPGVLLASFLVDFAGVAISVAAAVLSHLVRKAADLQEQSELTI